MMTLHYVMDPDFSVGDTVDCWFDRVTWGDPAGSCSPGEHPHAVRQFIERGLRDE